MSNAKGSLIDGKILDLRCSRRSLPCLRIPIGEAPRDKVRGLILGETAINFSAQVAETGNVA